MEQIGQLQNELEKVLALNSELQHRLRIDCLEMKLRTNSVELPARFIDSGPMSNQERRAYEEKLQSKRALIQLLNRKVCKLEEELAVLAVKCEHLQSELISRLEK